MPDPYMVIKDFDSYRRRRQQVDKNTAALVFGGSKPLSIQPVPVFFRVT